MRCACPQCEAFMIQSEAAGMTCVCPDCGYRCNACLGTATVISREQLDVLKHYEWIKPDFNSSTTDEDEEDPSFFPKQ